MIIPYLIADSAGPIENLRQTGLETGFSLPHLFAQTVAFLIVAGCLNQFAYKPVRNILEQRRRAIEEGIANAQKIKQEVADTEATRKTVIQKANNQASDIIAEATKAATLAKEEIIQKAETQAAEIVAKANTQAQQDIQRMRVELRNEIGSLVLLATQQLTGRVLTPADQQGLENETRQFLESSKN